MIVRLIGSDGYQRIRMQAPKLYKKGTVTWSFLLYPIQFTKQKKVFHISALLAILVREGAALNSPATLTCNLYTKWKSNEKMDDFHVFNCPIQQRQFFWQKNKILFFVYENRPLFLSQISNILIGNFTLRNTCVHWPTTKKAINLEKGKDWLEVSKITPFPIKGQIKMYLTFQSTMAGFILTIGREIILQLEIDFKAILLDFYFLTPVFEQPSFDSFPFIIWMMLKTSKLI